jgi:hypothetical protein
MDGTDRHMIGIRNGFHGHTARVHNPLDDPIRLFRRRLKHLNLLKVFLPFCGNKEFAAKRLGYLQGVRELPASPKAKSIANLMVSRGILPPKALEDAYHAATCAIHGIDYLLTWNCRHLANPKIFGKVEKLLCALGYSCPRMLTPEEMMKEVENG